MHMGKTYARRETESYARRETESKETYKRDLQKIPTKETYKRDLQKRPTKETCKTGDSLHMSSYARRETHCKWVRRQLKSDT